MLKVMSLLTDIEIRLGLPRGREGRERDGVEIGGW